MLRHGRGEYTASIYVVGVGGGGITAVDRLLKRQVYGVHYVVVDSAGESLAQSQAHTKIKVNEDGRGLETLRLALHRADLVFILGGLGGNTATGLAPAVAAIAREESSLVLAIFTLPFSFESEQRTELANVGAARLKEQVDTLITIPNDRLLETAGDQFPFHHTYRLAEEIWYQSIQGVNRLVNGTGTLNIDFADVKTMMSDGGPVVITHGYGRGPRRARQAALQATRCDRLGIVIDGAKGVLFNLTAGPEITLAEVQEVASVIGSRVDPDANLIIGTTLDLGLDDEVEITLIATGCGVPAALPVAAPAMPLMHAFLGG